MAKRVTSSVVSQRSEAERILTARTKRKIPLTAAYEHRAFHGWGFYSMMFFIVFGLALLFVGCSSAPGTFTGAGTAAHFSGTICGQATEFSLSDMKDRSQATVEVECPEGGKFTVSTADSSTTAVIAAQAANIQALTAMIIQLAGAGAQ